MALKVVLTGAANGIGKALSRRFLKEGATVWGLDKDAKSLEELHAESKKFGQEFVPLHCDLSDHKDFETRTNEILKAATEIDVWINNAGISGLGDFLNHSFENFQRVLEINLTAVVLGTRLALLHMEGRGKGKIVNIASVAGHIPCPYLTAYAASKFAVVGFTQSLREELRLKQVPVKIILVSPGFVDTQMIGRGTEHGFPEYLAFLLADSTSVANEIFEGVRKGKEEIFPSLNGKLLAGFGRHFPNITAKGSRLLLSKSLKDLFLFRRIPPR